MTNEEFIQRVSLPGEEWRKVVGYDGRYYISSHGRLIRSKTKTCPMRLMCPFRSNKHRKQSYLHIRLTKSGVSHHHTIHRLVAMAFIPNPNNYPCIDHIDGNGENNRVDNLRWCTRSMNNRNPISIRRQAESHLGKKMPFRKAVVQLKDGTLIATFNSVSEVEEKGFSHSCVSRVCNGQLANHKGFQWKYLSDYESQVSMSKNS